MIHTANSYYFRKEHEPGYLCIEDELNFFARSELTFKCHLDEFQALNS
jgi:hypothetical protein